jgi:hypothetical protein
MLETIEYIEGLISVHQDTLKRSMAVAMEQNGLDRAEAILGCLKQSDEAAKLMKLMRKEFPASEPAPIVGTRLEEPTPPAKKPKKHKASKHLSEKVKKAIAKLEDHASLVEGAAFEYRPNKNKRYSLVLDGRRFSRETATEVHALIEYFKAFKAQDMGKLGRLKPERLRTVRCFIPLPCRQRVLGVSGTAFDKSDPLDMLNKYFAHLNAEQVPS